MTKDLSALMDIACTAARAAGDYLYKREDIIVDENTRRDIKLSSDKASESIILSLLKPTGIPVLSEEKGFVGTESEDFCWIVDPLDGTVNYFRDLDDLACVSIALWEAKKPVLGVIYRFRTDEMFTGTVGQGAFLNAKPIHCATTTGLPEAILATGLPKGADFSESSLLLFSQLMQSVKKVRMLGTAAVMGAYVAAGKFDIYRENGIMLWDIAASAALVKAAGGQVNIQFLDERSCRCRFYATAALQEAFEKLDRMVTE